MTIVCLMTAAVLAVVFLFIRRSRAPKSREQLVERAFQFFSGFCALRREHEILGTAKLSFRQNKDRSVSLLAEITMLFSGSTVTMREEVGRCTKGDVPLLADALRRRLLSAFPGSEVDIGARCVFIR